VAKIHYFVEYFVGYLQKHASQCVFQQKLATFEKSENWGKKKHCARPNPASIQQNSQGESKKVMIDALSA
jgi:hypothetical protein